MALNLQGKKTIVAEVSEATETALSVVAASNSGVAVNEIADLRKAAREANVYMRVVRNTLLHRIFEGTKFECLRDECTGPTLIAFSNDHPGSAARLFKNFADMHPNFRIKAAAFDGKLILSKDIDYLALMPTYEEALVRLILTMKEAAGGKLARTLVAVRDKKETEVI